MTRHYRLTAEEWITNNDRFRPAEIKVLYYLRTLDPFGNGWLDVVVTDIGKALKLDKGTVSRALRRLAETKEIDLEIKTARVRLISLSQELSVDNVLSTDNVDDRETTSMIVRQPNGSVDNTSFSEPAPEASFKDPECTNRSNKEFKRTIGTSTVAPSSLNSDGLGTKLDLSNPYETEVKALLMLATQAGIKTNGTHSRTIAALRLQRSAAETRLAVEKSVSAVAEQIKRGKCNNPSAMFNASLQRELNGQGFTANEAKRNTKGRTEEPSLNEVALSISKALERHDRAWALGRLQQLWDDGYQNLIEEMLHLFKREWGFSLTAQGVRDGCG